MLLPKPRGTLSEALFRMMRQADDPPDAAPDPEDDEDAAIALWSLYELSYLGFEDVDDAWEWEPRALAVRRRLEHDFEQVLRERYRAPARQEPLAESLFEYIAGHDGASLAAHVQKEASQDQARELLRLRSIYHLKEVDPSAWTLPRLPVQPKAALAEVLYDEYGAGDPNRLHAHLFATGMSAAGLRPEYGAYVDEVPTEILHQNNAMSLFGLHRRWRGAAMGHLAAFEATSSVPSRQLAQGLERLGFAPELVAYYTEHVEADAVHEQLAVRSLCGALVGAEPDLVDDVFFGAFTCLDLEDRVATKLLTTWEAA